MTAPGAAPAWVQTPERGSGTMLRLMVGICRTLGWRAGHVLLYPIVGYFLASSPRQRRTARVYLTRALGRAAGWRDLFRLYFAFASTILDRVWLVSRQTEGWRIEVTGLPALQDVIAEGRGCLLFGAHFGSFEALRAVADAGCPVEVSVLMHEANAQRVKALFDALGGPARTSAIIPLGLPDSMLRVRECLERGGLVGLLADRAAPRGSALGERFQRLPFLGHPADLPTGPHLLAAVLGVPVMLAFGIWRGPRHYEIRFERFSAGRAEEAGRAAREAAVARSAASYAGHLESLCRAYPYNWFNFHDFWNQDGA